MQVASMLSDLSSLQACDSSAALALVSVRPGQDEGTATASAANGEPQDDVDLKRAKDLLQLHSSIKLAHGDGTDKLLNDARQDVERVMQSL